MIKVLEKNGDLIIEVDGEVKVWEDYRATDVILNFADSVDFDFEFDPETDKLEDVFESTPKEYILSGIDALKAEGLTFMSEKEHEELIASYQEKDLSNAKLIKTY